MIREPVVAGRFYQGTAAGLRAEVARYVDEKRKKCRAIGIVSPHAGFMYSGPAAGAAFSAVNLPDTFVILGPNHTGYGKPGAIQTTGAWKTPLGTVKIDEALGKAILSGSDFLEEDEIAFASEHSIEVQLPFIQYFKKEFSFVPICLGTAQLSHLTDTGEAIAKAVKHLKKEVLLVASSDMSHYEPQADAERKDKSALEAILNMDEKLLLKKVAAENISMCGFGPVSSVLVAGRALGAKSAKLVKYMTSGDTSGDYSAVVGYAAVAIE